MKCCNLTCGRATSFVREKENRVFLLCSAHLFVPLQAETNKKKRIMTSVAMNNLWSYIQGLSLSARNQEWLAARLREASQMKRAKAKKDETLMTKEEFFAQVDEAREQIKRGEGITFTNLEDMNAWLNAL
jgi:hypothetical protein